MSRKLQAALALLCMTTYAAAGTTVLGTASARGDMRVDGYTVQGDATVFDGSVVETQNASAVLRVAHGVAITLSKSSRGTVYRNRFVLQGGETEVAAPGSYALEANGLHVTAGQPHSVGLVALTHKNAVEVAALSGSFEVRDGQGLLLSNVLPGRALSFALQSSTTQPGIVAPYFASTVGMVSVENGHYYLTSDQNIKYELVGNDLQGFVGDKVVVSGTLQPASQAAPQPGQMAGTISVKTIQLNGPGGAGPSKAHKWIIAAIAAGGAGEVAWVIYDAEQPPHPISVK